MALTEETYRDNFIKGVKIVMANANLDTLKDAAEHLGINYMTLYKIMGRNNFPTVDQCVTLCLKGGFSANWLFLNKGSKEMGEVLTLEKIYRKL